MFLFSLYILWEVISIEAKCKPKAFLFLVTWEVTRGTMSVSLLLCGQGLAKCLRHTEHLCAE